MKDRASCARLMPNGEPHEQTSSAESRRPDCGHRNHPSRNAGGLAHRRSFGLRHVVEAWWPLCVRSCATSLLARSNDVRHVRHWHGGADTVATSIALGCRAGPGAVCRGSFCTGSRACPTVKATCVSWPNGPLDAVKCSSAESFPVAAGESLGHARLTTADVGRRNSTIL
jgi:hypothetical protein